MVIKISPLNKKSQITIFVIMALIIIVIIAIFFLLRAPPEVRVFDENEPQSFIESCTKEYVEEAIFLINQHGGDIEPKGSVSFNNLDRTYLCYNINYFDPCINQRPLLIEHIEEEITNYIRPHLERCFEELKQNFEKRHEVSLDKEMQITTTLQPKNVYVNVGRNLEATRGENSRSFEEFEMHFNHPIYNFAEIAMEIVNQETEFCNFDVIGYMILYPEYDVKRIITGDSNIIYKITERATNQEFTFASRGCVLPPTF